jgi:hypothetical protein
MVCHKCPTCDLEFNKKSRYFEHINKKFKCKSIKKDEIITNKIPIKIQSEFNFDLENLKNSENLKNPKKYESICDNDDNNKFCCGYCYKSYSTKSNLYKHLKTNCKVKQKIDEEKEKIFKLLLNKENELKMQQDMIKEQKQMISQILQQNQILINEIKNLKKTKTNKSKDIKNVNSHNTNISNSNNTTNTNNNIVMINFGKEDLGIIDKQQYFDRVVRKPISGVKIPEEILKIIHFNPQYPQLSNIYISDINREKCMVWQDGEWKLSPVDKIPEVIDQVVNYSNDVENELRNQYSDNKKMNDRLDVINKYVKMNDNDHVQELKDELSDEEADNIVQIKRCEDFQKLTYDTFKTTLYNEGKNVKKSYKKV